MTLFDGRAIARGWLAVAVASGTDNGRPQLHKTISIETFGGGVRLVATDSYLLLRAWVPNIDHDLDPEPDLEEAPYASAVAMDPHGRAKGFLAHVLKLANATGDDALPVEVRLNLGVIDEVDQSERPSFAGFEARYVTLELPDSERLKLLTYEGTYPQWRNIRCDPVPSDAIALNPEIVGRLSKLGSIHPGSLLGFTWGGPDKAAGLRLVNSDPNVEGVVMPVRWDFDANAPRDDETDDDRELAAP